MSQWFVETPTQIEGPYSTETVQNRLLAGSFQHGDKIWGRALPEWRTLGWWIQSLKELANVEKQISSPEVWHYAYAGSTFGPLAWKDLLNNLKGIRTTSMDQLVHLMIWTKGMKEWTSVLEFHEIMDALGVNRRESPRSVIQGKAVIKTASNTFIAPLQHISEGGFGCDPVSGLSSGDDVTVEIQSEGLRAPVRSRAQVRYVTERIAGFKFQQLNVESRGLIVQYVKKSMAPEKLVLKTG